MIPLGISIGLAVRMGHVIAHNPNKAKRMAAWCMGFIVVIGAMVALLLHTFRYEIIHMFTTDDDVIHGALNIWPSLCCYIFLIYIFGINHAILRALGMQWRLAAIISVSLYFFTLPTVVYLAVIRGGGLETQWKILPIFYTGMQAALVIGYMAVDWEKHSHAIREGMLISIIEAKEIEPTEQTSLLTENDAPTNYTL